LLFLVAACGAVDPTVDSDTAFDPILGGELDPGPQPTAKCAVDPDGSCLYLPDTSGPLESFVAVAYDVDRLGGPRVIPMLVRYSPTAPRPMPVVVWSPGGVPTYAPTELEEWGAISAHGGYLSVVVAHQPRTDEERIALCAAYNLDGPACAAFKTLSYDRPLDVARAIDEIVVLAARPEWVDRIDTTRIAIGGHAAGASGALMVAGSTRDINGTPVLLPDLRPRAFIAMSPQAPGIDGMTAEGYALVERPTLIGTGRGDDDPEQTADARATVFDYFPPGDKARIFIEDENARHGLFALETDGCVATGAALDECLAMRDWVISAGLAFLDAYVRDSGEAFEFLSSSNLDVASDGVAEWSLR
jgi:hypothetical protein